MGRTVVATGIRVMNITLDCRCGTRFAAPAASAGQKIPCPGCHQPVAVPDEMLVADVANEVAAASSGSDFRTSAPFGPIPAVSHSARSSNSRPRGPVDIVGWMAVGSLGTALTICLVVGLTYFRAAAPPPAPVPPVSQRMWQSSTLQANATATAAAANPARVEGDPVPAVPLPWRGVVQPTCRGQYELWLPGDSIAPPTTFDPNFANAYGDYGDLYRAYCFSATDLPVKSPDEIAKVLARELGKHPSVSIVRDAARTHGPYRAHSLEVTIAPVDIRGRRSNRGFGPVSAFQQLPEINDPITRGAIFRTGDLPRLGFGRVGMPHRVSGLRSVIEIVAIDDQVFVLACLTDTEQKLTDDTQRFFASLRPRTPEKPTLTLGTLRTEHFAPPTNAVSGN